MKQWLFLSQLKVLVLLDTGINSNLCAFKVERRELTACFW